MTLRPLGAGWDNTVFLVNESFVFRFPRREIAVACMEAEIRVLPGLVGGLGDDDVLRERCADAYPGLRCAPPWANITEPFGLQNLLATHPRRLASPLMPRCPDP